LKNREDLLKKHNKNENIKGDVEVMEPNEGRDREMVEKKEVEFSQKDKRNPKLTPHKYLDKYVFNDLHEVFFYDFLACVARVDIEVERKLSYKLDQTSRM
jgi:hypothetical protein